ncbi:expressed unknown protein [Seminavis robusta]|uniref:Uncharacterized protein n=1 Tax=Seminavis robusta TaxID=568900 RepID=A0A9N8E7K8_9STRA|nr:expressed unknown protein [Seminavis robusta]|eukprot:Sro769_g199770.1 n/a (419) ;mRNA; f:15276-16532
MQSQRNIDDDDSALANKVESFQRSLSLSNLDIARLFQDDAVLSAEFDDNAMSSSNSSFGDDIDALWENASNAEQWASKQARQEAFLKASAMSHENQAKKKNHEEVQFDCFGFPLFDLQADSPPPPRTSQKADHKPCSFPELPSMSLLDSEKAARRARRRRSKNTAKSDSALPVATALLPPPPPPMRRRRSTGLLSCKSHHQQSDASNIAEPFAKRSRSSAGLKAEEGSARPRRRKSFNGGTSGLLGLDKSLNAHSMSSSQRCLRTSGRFHGMSSSQRGHLHSPQSSRHRLHQSRRPRRTLSDGFLCDLEAEESAPSHHGKTTVVPASNKRSRRRSGSRRRSVVAGTSPSNHNNTIGHNHGKERRDSGRSADKSGPHNNKTERRRARKNDACPGTPKRLNRSARNLMEDSRQTAAGVRY